MFRKWPTLDRKKCDDMIRYLIIFRNNIIYKAIPYIIYSIFQFHVEYKTLCNHIKLYTINIPAISKNSGRITDPCAEDNIRKIDENIPCST